MDFRYNIFLKAKAWHIFSMFLGIMIISPILTLNLHLPFGLSRFFMPLQMLFILVWLYVLGTQLYSIGPEIVPSKIGLFKGSIILTAVFLYLFIFLYFGPEMTSWPAILLAILINLGFIYSIFFVAKAIVYAEFREKSGFQNVGMVIILIWLFPIGVWFIQPRLQKIYTKISRTDA